MKYYIQSNKNQLIINAKSKKEAIKLFLNRVFEKNKSPTLSPLTKISEIGFKIHKSDVFFDTEKVLEELGP